MHKGLQSAVFHPKYNQGAISPMPEGLVYPTSRMEALQRSYHQNIQL